MSLEIIKATIERISCDIGTIVDTDRSSIMFTNTSIELKDADLAQTYEEARELASELGIAAARMASVAGSLKKMLSKLGA